MLPSIPVSCFEMKTTHVSRYEYNIFNDESETAIFFSLCDVIVVYKNGAISGQPVPIFFLL